VVGELGREKAVLCLNDLAKVESAKELVDVAVRAYGRIDALVNNAASVKRSNVETTSAEVFDFIIGVNLRAPLMLIREALPELKKSRGAVLNIGSVNAWCGEPNLLAYSISKGGLMTLTRNLADALGRDQVRVNQLNLGWILTENERRLKISEGMAEDWYERPPLEYVPSGRLITPEQVATACVYWIGDESRPISGTVAELNQYPVLGRNPPKS
jgi:NAD(P)-dependent dehydrogenase (short-subunit alcohol dehydrogenase family)